MSNLLEKAKQSVKRKNAPVVTDEILELILAWCKDEITASQVVVALNLASSPTQMYVIATHAFKKYIKEKGLKS